MKRLITVFLFLILIVPFSVLANGNAVKELRRNFYEASNEKISLDQFDLILKEYKSNESPIYKGYKSMYFMLVSRASWNPFSKYSNFTEGKELLELAIKEDAINVELRYLRYCIQRTLPGFLNYSMHKDIDKEIIINSWNEIKDEDLKEKIKTYFIDNKVEGSEFLKTIKH